MRMPVGKMLEDELLTRRAAVPGTNIDDLLNAALLLLAAYVHSWLLRRLRPPIACMPA